MKVINYGNTFEIYQNDLKTFDKLPADTYHVSFHPMAGFSLKRADNFEIKEEKIYGDRTPKINKILKTFEAQDRSLGVILSGDKGIGKSLFTQMLSIEANKKDMPVILITKAYPGIADFIDSIDQESLILFDEFEKVFDDSDEKEQQNSLLSLFDGLSQRKRIYAITVNNLSLVNDFMLNRPGRFHYHLRFDYPSAEEISVYLEDKVTKDNHKEIPNVVKFAQRIKLNYDCLRAIALELNYGEKFSEAIKDLNILNISPVRYNIEIFLKNIKNPIVKEGLRLNLFGDTNYLEFRVPNKGYYEYSFSGEDVLQNEAGVLYVDGKNMTMISCPSFYDDDDDEYKKEDVVIDKIIISQIATNKYGFGAF